MPELVTNGMRLVMITRNKPAAAPRKGLSPAQLAWCRSKWPWFEHNRVQRLSDADARRDGR